MDDLTSVVIAAVSIFTAGLSVGMGAVGPALGEGRAAAHALSALAQQPDEANPLPVSQASVPVRQACRETPSPEAASAAGPASGHKP